MIREKVCNVKHSNIKRSAMTDDRITALIFAEIEKRGITWRDMVGGKSISFDAGHERVFKVNAFKSEHWSNRLIELICEGAYDPDDDTHALRVSIEDLMRFWWNNCIDQADMLDGILEDVFMYFKDKLLPKVEPTVIQYDVNFLRVIPESGRRNIKMKNRMTENNMKMFTVTSICKQDIIQAFEGSDRQEQVREKVAEMDNRDMKLLASKMADDYCNQLFWDSLKNIFEDRFIEKEIVNHETGSCDGM